MTDLEKAREFFANDRFATVATGAEIDEIGPQYAKCSLKLKENHRNALGIVMGGAIYTLADFAFAVATNFNQTSTVTMTNQINYLTAAKGDILYAMAKVIKNGKRTCYVEIQVTDNLGNLVAIVNTTGMHV